MYIMHSVRYLIKILTINTNNILHTLKYEFYKLSHHFKAFSNSIEFITLIMYNIFYKKISIIIAIFIYSKKK